MSRTRVQESTRLLKYLRLLLLRRNQASSTFAHLSIRSREKLRFVLLVRFILRVAETGQVWQSDYERPVQKLPKKIFAVRQVIESQYATAAWPGGPLGPTPGHDAQKPLEST